MRQRIGKIRSLANSRWCDLGLVGVKSRSAVEPCVLQHQSQSLLKAVQADNKGWFCADDSDLQMIQHYSVRGLLQHTGCFQKSTVSLLSNFTDDCNKSVYLRESTHYKLESRIWLCHAAIKLAVVTNANWCEGYCIESIPLNPYRFLN